MFPASRRKDIAAIFAAYAPAPLNDSAVPPFPGREDDDEDDSKSLGRDVGFECAEYDWRPIAPATPAAPMPLRFIDGSIMSRTAGSLLVEYRRRPVIAATISAAALRLEGRGLKREPGARTLKALCVNSNGIDAADLAAAQSTLADLGVRLLTSETENPTDFDSMRRSARQIGMLAMEELERDVMLADAETPTLVDGLLERRLAGQRLDVPVFGLVKRQIASYLPTGLQEMVYGLKPGERSPAFVLETVQHVDIVNTYVRLSAPAGMSPTYGIVRVTAPLRFIEANYAGESLTAFLSGLAGYLYGLRHRDEGYSRAGISVEPIVRVEDHLHSIIPSIDVLVARLNGLLKGRVDGVAV